MLQRSISAVHVLIVIVLFISANLHAQPKTRIDCDRLHTLSGGYGKDVIWLPTPDDVVHGMLAIAQTSEDDYVIDLGAGDGKIAIAAARDFGAHALGIEYEPDLVKYANCLVEVENVADKVQIRRGDIFKEDFSKADVVTLYLLPNLNLCVRHRLLAMKPSTRVASHDFSMGDWPHDDKAKIGSDTVYLWIVPARVGGDWNFRQTDGEFRFNISLNQTYQKINGEAIVDQSKRPLLNTELAGDKIRFEFDDGKGSRHMLTGTVHGDKITGVLKTASGDRIPVSGAAKAEPVAGEWASMAPGCDQYYSPEVRLTTQSESY